MQSTDATSEMAKASYATEVTSFFAIIVFANVELFHSETLNEITTVYAGSIAVTFAAAFLSFTSENIKPIIIIYGYSKNKI